MIPNGSTNKETYDPVVLALRALAWTVAQPAIGQRLLDVTGLDVDDLRAAAGDPTTLAAVLGFLESHEPDLIACADELGVKPEALAAAHRALEA